MFSRTLSIPPAPVPFRLMVLGITFVLFLVVAVNLHTSNVGRLLIVGIIAAFVNLLICACWGLGFKYGVVTVISAANQAALEDENEG